MIYVIGTSGSMSGEKIDQINTGLRKAETSLYSKFGLRLSIDILQFDSASKWRTLDQLPLKARGTANIGTALAALSRYGANIHKDSPCAILFTSDSFPTDAYKAALYTLQSEGWFRTAAKAGIAIGGDADVEVLADLTGSQKTVIFLEDIHTLGDLLRDTSTVLAIAAEKNASGKTIPGDFSLEKLYQRLQRLII